MLILGVDGGATKTICSIIDEKKELFGAGKAGPGNFYHIGTEEAKENVELSVKRAFSSAGLNYGRKVQLGSFGMGGLKGGKEKEIVSSFIKSLDLAEEYIIQNDVIEAYYAVTLGKPGIAVIAGTGSMGAGSLGDGEISKVGGWGWLIGDEGGAFYIARKALRRVTKAVDNRAEDTLLADFAKNHFDAPTFDDLPLKIYGELPRPQSISSFAKKVSEAAEEGDEAAKDILREAGNELFLHIKAEKKKLGVEDQSLIVGGVGSVWNSRTIREVFESKVKEYLPNLQFREPVQYPVVGALAIGLREKGIEITEEEMLNLEQDIAERLEKQREERKVKGE